MLEGFTFFFFFKKVLIGSKVVAFIPGVIFPMLCFCVLLSPEFVIFLILILSVSRCSTLEFFYGFHLFVSFLGLFLSQVR